MNIIQIIDDSPGMNYETVVRYHLFMQRAHPRWNTWKFPAKMGFFTVFDLVHR